jgi:hypothetical protein
MSGVGAQARRRPTLVSFKLNKTPGGANPRVADGGPPDVAAVAVAGAWSARRTFAFVMITCGAFWAAVLALILR